jgi:hypothetical protein
MNAFVQISTRGVGGWYKAIWRKTEQGGDRGSPRLVGDEVVGMIWGGTTRAAISHVGQQTWAPVRRALEPTATAPLRPPWNIEDIPGLHKTHLHTPQWWDYTQRFRKFFFDDASRVN